MKKSLCAALALSLLLLSGCDNGEDTSDVDTESVSGADESSSGSSADSSTVSVPEEREYFSTAEIARMNLSLLPSQVLVGADTLAELESCSDVVIIGRVASDAYQVKAKGGTYMSYAPVKITKSIKGGLPEGSTIEIAQQYGAESGRLISSSMLTPMLKGESWMFYLNQYGTGGKTFYSCYSDYYGRYPVPDAEYTKLPYAKDSVNGVYDKSYFRADIYSEILAKYKS